MTGHTHDLAAFTTLTIIIATQPLIHMSLATVMMAIGANMIGGLAPDIDQPASELWHKIPAGTLIGKIVSPFWGSHRTISHSFIGIGLFSWLMAQLLTYVHTFLLVDIDIVWFTFMLGYISHLVMDTFTKEGVP